MSWNKLDMVEIPRDNLRYLVQKSAKLESSLAAARKLVEDMLITLDIISINRDVRNAFRQRSATIWPEKAKGIV